MSSLLIGLEFSEELPPAVRAEFEQLVAALQAFIANNPISGSNTGDQMIVLTGDVTGTGTEDIPTTIVADAVTYAKMQNVSAASRLLGRGSTGGTGDPEEIVLGTGLTMSGTTLQAVAGGGWIPLVDGGEPPTFITDGAGHLILVAGPA